MNDNVLQWRDEMPLKKIILFVLVISFCRCLNSFADDKTAPIIEKEEIEKQISYALGYDILKQLKENFSLDTDLFILGIDDAKKNQPRLSEEKIKELFTSYQRILRQKQIEKMKLESENNRKSGAAFLESNRKKEGVVTLPSGLQYKILVDGKGPHPKPTDTVECHYMGTLIDEKVFDSSYERGEPAKFQVNRVIQGWGEALQIMKTGSTWILYVPADLAYGDRGAGDMIKPGTTLVFKIELLKIL
jgi:FKBP-type peptidyl-prolyl cis-trans isomerase